MVKKAEIIKEDNGKLYIVSAGRKRRYEGKTALRIAVSEFIRSL